MNICMYVCAKTSAVCLTVHLTNTYFVIILDETNIAFQNKQTKSQKSFLTIRTRCRFDEFH